MRVVLGFGWDWVVLGTGVEGGVPGAGRRRVGVGDDAGSVDEADRVAVLALCGWFEASGGRPGSACDRALGLLAPLGDDWALGHAEGLRGELAEAEQRYPDAKAHLARAAGSAGALGFEAGPGPPPARPRSGSRSPAVKVNRRGQPSSRRSRSPAGAGTSAPSPSPERTSRWCCAPPGSRTPPAAARPVSSRRSAGSLPPAAGTARRSALAHDTLAALRAAAPCQRRTRPGPGARCAATSPPLTGGRGHSPA